MLDFKRESDLEEFLFAYIAPGRKCANFSFLLAKVECNHPPFLYHKFAYIRLVSHCHTTM